MIFVKIAQMNGGFAREIAAWRYEGAYAAYNLPPWERMEAGGFALADAKKWREFRVFIGESGEVLAFSRQIETDMGIKLGLGVHPGFLSRGIGSRCVKMHIAELGRLSPGVRVYLEVREWNKRAIRCYEKCGFEIEQTFEQTTQAGPGVFCRMALKADNRL